LRNHGEVPVTIYLAGIPKLTCLATVQRLSRPPSLVHSLTAFLFLSHHREEKGIIEAGNFFTKLRVVKKGLTITFFSLYW